MTTITPAEIQFVQTHSSYRPFPMRLVQLIREIFQMVKHWFQGHGFVTTQARLKAIYAKMNPIHQIVEKARSRTGPLSIRVDQNNLRQMTYLDTLSICAKGKYTAPSGAIRKLNHQPMLDGTVAYTVKTPLSPKIPPTPTVFRVIEDDTFNVMAEHAKQNLNPCGVNFANAFQPGGGVGHGAAAQEEELCRRSNHILGLTVNDQGYSEKHYLQEQGGIYCPDVTVFKEAKTYALMENPITVALVAVAAFSLCPESYDRAQLGFSPRGEISESECRNNAGFVKGTKDKIRNMLRMMAEKGHQRLVLGALGCGAFVNPPDLIAELFHDVFNEPEFIGQFKQVDFAILVQNAKDAKNVAAFRQKFP